MVQPERKKYAELSFNERVHTSTILLRLPFLSLWLLLRNILWYRRPIEVKRATAIGLIRWINGTCSIPQMQFLLPSSRRTYELWSKFNNLPITVEELVGDAMLFWIGAKRTDRVVLYVHGGALFCPLLPNQLDFWLHVQSELAKRDLEVGVAVLAYTLIPTAYFPTQLHQATVALEHILASGVHPSDLHIVGDSAGAQIILSLLSHILHPLETPHTRKIVPSLFRSSTPIKGVYLMSPWVRLHSTSTSFRANPSLELFSTKTATEFGDAVLQGIADVPQYMPYMEPDKAPENWFSGLDNIVDRILMTAGGGELFRDDIIRFSQTLGRVKKSNFTFVVQEGGVHDDPFVDALVKVRLNERPTSLTPLIVHWLAAGLKPLK